VRGMQRGAAATSRVPRLLIADRMLVSMPYRDADSITWTSVDAYKTYPYQTSPYDPYSAAGGHQPMGYDQYALLFTNIRCYAITGTIRLVNKGAVPITWGITYSNSGSIVGIAAALEDPTCNSTICGITPDTSVLDVNLSASRVLGMTNEQYRTEDNTLAVFGGNPNRVAYAIVLLTTAEFDQDGACDMITDLVFHCELQGRRQFAQS